MNLAKLVTGINSNLPGRITAQVSRNVYDSATGHRLLVPQGASSSSGTTPMSRSDKSRAVTWTDLISRMDRRCRSAAGVEAQGHGGIRDQVDDKYPATFGSAILIALIGTGIGVTVPVSSMLATRA